MPRPKNQKEVKQFLGLIGYYRKFVPRFADISRVLNKLTRKDEEFKWTPECDKCVTGSSFNKFPAACKSAELIDWTHKQLKRITFVKQQVYSVCEPRKISYINKLTKDNISVSIKATQYEPTK